MEASGRNQWQSAADRPAAVLIEGPTQDSLMVGQSVPANDPAAA
jgi:hypothetical protein